MASAACDVIQELDGSRDTRITRPAGNVRTTTVNVTRRALWHWTSLALAAGGIGALTVHLLNHSVPSAGARFNALTSLPASVYFDGEHAAINAEGRAAIAAIARAVSESPNPVVVTGYANRQGKRDRNLRLVQKQAAIVRKALVSAGVPTMRVVVVSPTFTDSGDSRRVEVALVQGARAFPPAGR